MAFTAFGVSEGLACSISTAAPATTGAAMLVPLRARYARSLFATVPFTSCCALVTKNMLFGLDSEMLPWPGATRSGFADQSRYVGPRDEKLATVSSSRRPEPLVLDAPTVSTQGALPGAVMPP